MAAFLLLNSITQGLNTHGRGRSPRFLAASYGRFSGFVCLNLGYWQSHASAFSWIDCLYGSNECSLAAGTWSLTFVTLAAFVAAVVAAIYAAHTYALETSRSLGHTLCADTEHKNTPDVTLYISSARGRPLNHEPLHFKVQDFEPQHHAFLNLGRAPLTDVAVNYKIKVSGQQKLVTGRLELDCVQVDGEIHATIFVRKSIGTVRITWNNASANSRSG